MNRNSILALALVFLVVLMLPLYVDAQQFPTGTYKYRAKRVSSRTSNLPGDVSSPSVVLGSDDFEKLRNFSKSSAIYQLGRKVAHLQFKINGASFCCSGFLVGPDLLLTNHHCFFEELKHGGQQYPLKAYRVYMDYYSDDWEGEVSAGVKQLLNSSRILDYALFQLDKPLGDTYGWLNLDPITRLQRGSKVMIIQHPDCRSKEIVRTNSSVTQVFADMIHYQADTEGGSSGSPVFDANSHKVIALHHVGIRGYANEGVLMKQIYLEIQPFIDNSLKARIENLRKTNESLRLTKSGQKKSELDQYNAAIKDFDAAIRLKPDNHTAYLERGTAKFLLDQYNAAIKDLTQPSD